ncbi:MAG: MASE1 domain-containing protein [Candidatus Omnitrophica bacterium]|nr:MASE1 domain-containing protein [Candidatus Omnitrophota bacterium]
MPDLEAFITARLTKVLDACTARRVYEGMLVALLAVVYYFMALWGLQMSFQNTNATPLWPPSGIAFMATLIFGYRLWPGIWLGAFLANTVVFTANSVDLPAAGLMSAFIGAGNTLESLLGVFLLNSLTGGRNPLLRIQDIFKFVAAVFAAALVSATTGTLAVHAFKQLSWPVLKVMWCTWWMGDVLSILILTPFFLVACEASLKIWPARKILEALALLTVLIVINGNIFGWESFVNVRHFPVMYLILPLMVWATYRFSYWGVTVVSLITIFWGFAGTIHGVGPFVGQDLNVSLLSLQSFVGILTITGLVLAAALHERRQAEQALQESELRFRTMADTAPVMVWMSGADMICTFFNKAWLDFRGKGLDHELGHGWIQGLFQDDIKRCWAIYMKSFKGREAFTMDYRLRRADGKYRWILATGVPRFAADGGFSGYIGSCIDITERKLAEEVLKRDKESLEKLVDERSKELVSAQKELRQASRLADIGTLAATVAHELRNPLGVIQMAAYNLKKKTKSLEMDKHLLNIEKKVWEGNGIIDNLLSYSRIKIPSYERVMLFNVLDECVGIAHGRFHDYNIMIEKKYEAGPLEAIEADPYQIREIFINVLNNACQSFVNKTGRIEVAVKLESQDRVSIVFSDNGTGIDEADLDKIFEPFFTRKSKGTGLGLTICNELVNLHQGKIEITSRKDEGTSVHIILPVTRNSHG